MTDLEKIKQLEKEIGTRLKQSSFRGSSPNRRGYNLNGIGSVISLSMFSLKLKSIPLIIFEFQNLFRLFFRRNLLTNIPKEIAELKKLGYLDLSSNKLTELPKEIAELRNLRNLFLNNNQLKELPKEIIELKLDIKWELIHPYKGIFLGGNPLESPPVEIVKKGVDAVRAYFESLEGEKRPLNEIKVLLVGDGGAGKTSLVKQLLGKEFDKNESQTHGINIDNWYVNDGEDKIKVNFWDFGGQEIMHATHQFFLSRRSLYILVLDGRKDEKTEYWLKHIKSFGGDSPVLVVINKIDENPGFDVNRPFLQDKYNGIKGFYRVSCAKSEGVEAFLKGLSEELLKVEMRRTPFAKSWFDVKEKLERMEDDFISCKRYEEICKKVGVDDKTAQDALIDYLNDLGVALHFKDFALEDVHVLEPGWATGAVYKIINSVELADNNGILKLSRLKDILKQEEEDKYYYPPDKFPYIIELMKKFELCYDVNRWSVLIPDLTEVQEPPFGFDYGDALKFRIDYDFLPRSVMPRFIVNMHEDIDSNLRWRTGVVLKDKDFKSRAVIKADEADKKIFIYVNGAQKRDYFAVILSAFRKINSSFEKLEAVEKVCMPDQQNITVSYEHLIRLEKKGETEYLPDGSEEPYIVQKLLGSIDFRKGSEEEIMKILEKIYNKLGDTDILQFKPKIFGVLDVDINALYRKLKKKQE